MSRTTEATRRSLERAAIELYAERGYAGTTVAAVAGRVGLTERTFFRHFPDKSEVLFADDGALVDAMLAAVRDRTAPVEAWDLAEQALFAAAGVLQERRDELRLRSAVIAANPELVAHDAAKRDRLVALLDKEMIERGAEPGPAALAAAVAGAVWRVAYGAWLADEAGVTLREEVEGRLADLRAGVETRRGRGR